MEVGTSPELYGAKVALHRLVYLTPPAPPLLAPACTCTRGEKKQRLFWVLLAQQQQPPRNTMVSDPPQVDTDPMQ